MAWKRFAAVVMAAALLVGCSSTKGTQSAPSTDKKAEPVTISYMTFSAAPDHLKDLDAMVKAFQDKNPDIKVQVQPVAFDQYFTKLQTAVSGGTAPDAYELNYENFVSYAKKGVLADLSAQAAQDKLDTVYSQGAYKVFNYSGKQYGLVESFSNVVLFYNKDLFDKAGVPYPTDKWTWKDELDAAQKLTDAKAGVWGSFEPLQFWEFYKVAAQNGGKLMDGSKVTINSKQNADALQYLIDRVNKYKIQPTDAQLGGQQGDDLFKAGKIAMTHTGIWQFGTFKDAPFKWDIAVEPGNTQKATHFFANAVVVSKDSKHADAAYKWAKFMTSSPEAVKVRMDASWELPAVADTKLVDSYLKQTNPANRKAVFDSLQYAVEPPVLDKWNEETDQVGKELEAARLGKITAAQALENAQKKLEDLLK
ncbi:MAG: ABC transporter substrate-binding protein [Mycobacterium leprae]